MNKCRRRRNRKQTKVSRTNRFYWGDGGVSHTESTFEEWNGTAWVPSLFHPFDFAVID